MITLEWACDHWKLLAGYFAVMGVVFVAGFGVGRVGRTDRIVTVTEYKDRVVEHTVTVEKPVVQWRDRVIVREVSRPDGTKIETRVDEHSGRETGEKVTTRDSDKTQQNTTQTITAPEGRWSVRALAGVNTAGGVVAGVGGEYRLAGPLTVGAWGTVPVAGTGGPVTVGVSLGLRF